MNDERMPEFSRDRPPLVERLVATASKLAGYFCLFVAFVGVFVIAATLLS